MDLNFEEVKWLLVEVKEMQDAFGCTVSVYILSNKKWKQLKMRNATWLVHEKLNAPKSTIDEHDKGVLDT